MSKGEMIMYCPECGNNLDGLKETCREEFDNKYGQYFHNLESVRSHRWYWRGVWIGIAIDLLLLCFLIGLGDWSFGGFFEIVRRISKNSYILLFVPFLFPIVIAMACSMIGFEDVNVEEEQSYQEFKKTWGLSKNTKLTL